MYDDDALCYTFADDGDGERDVSYSRHDGGRGGRGGRGRPRGPRRGRGGWVGSDQDSSLRRYSSSDSLNSRRGDREGMSEGGFRDRGRGGGGRWQGGGRGRDHSYDGSRGRRGHGERGGGRGYGGGGGGRSGRGGGRPRHFPLRQIVAIEDIDEITLRLTSQLEEFELFMSSDFMSDEDTTNALKILSRVVQNDIQRGSVLKVLQIVCRSRFLDCHLVSLIQNLASSLPKFGSHNVIETVEFIHQLLSKVCLKLPSYSSKCYLLLTLLQNMNIIPVIAGKRPNLAESVKELDEECQRCMKMMQDTAQKKENRSRFNRGPNEDDDIPPDDFSQLPVFPSAQDMDCTEKIFLRANKEEGAFRDVSHYLDIQFRLLREDYIRPLRKGIKEFKELRDRGEVFRKSQDLRLYQKVQIISMVCKDSLEHRVQFEMSHQLKRVRWQSSKRLLYGSLVCLTMDDFETLFFAVVTNRDAKDLEKGIVQIRFESGLSEILELSSCDTFTMAETTAYFEAYRHVLEGLREMKDALPMARYLVECNPTIKPPQYLLSAMGTGQMDLSSLLRKGSRWNASAVTIINPQRWPPREETTLNDSQMEAVRTALSKELAIIQGPPGTGKTYVGLKVAKVLLENRKVWMDPAVGSRPILVVCYTNHALDQFLEGILEFCPTGIVRVGSRCKNPQLEEFNLKNIRRKMRTDRKVSMSVRNSIRDCVRSLSAVKEKIDGVSAKLEATTKGVVGVPVLQHYMLSGQYDSLTKRNLYSSSAIQVNRNMIMMEWLSNGLITQAGGKEEEDGEDPYAMLAKEVTSQILQGQGTCQEGTIDPNGIHFLSPIVRAQLYRSWLQKAKTLLQQDTTRESLKWQQAAKREILPDSILQRVISGPIYSAITYQARQQEEQQTQFCVRAWLGVSEGSSLEAIVQGKDTRDEAYFTPRDVISLPRKTRIQLYRFWREKAILLLEKQKRQKTQPHAVGRNLAMAHREILPDEVLQNVVNPKLLEAIKNDLLQRLKSQSQYLIRAWLGIQEFCQNARDLERLLDQLESGEEMKAEDEQLNVVEEADFIQNERQLDLDDDDDLFDFVKKKSGGDVRSAMQELGVQTASTARSEAGGTDDDGFSVPKYHQKKQARKLQALLTSSKPMTEEEAQRVSNLWSQQMAVENRIRLYLFWLRKYQDSLRQSMKEHADTYNRDSQQLRELRLGEDKDILMEGTVIGMTTTGAARYRRVLAAVACPIIILEEAAEVMEAHVVTTLHKKCQHLILIGDHQQLRPSPTVYELCRHYKLDLSLFERLVNNSLPHSTLAVQHRMRPDVARLVRHVYPELKDHETTLGRPHIRGVKQDVFLFHHEEEETRNDETSSRSNQHEAQLCVRLCRYLLQQGYPPDTVTILTAYSGQVFALKNIMKNEQTFYQGVRVTAVDNYQGEENDVIILSLVRSNQEGSVGFLGTDNRVCVALSRARNGFYAFGNFKILADSSELWKNICRTAKEHGQLGDTLVLRCENHPGQQIEITTAKDFDKMPEGGCMLPCGTRLECGHMCELSCHGYDRKHEKYKCRKKCERRPCKLGHPCTKKCYEDCGQCLYKVEKTVPMCGHVATMECKRDPHTWDCKERCNGKLPCGHQCSGSCGDCRKRNSHVVKCKEEVERVWPCGHLVKSACDAPVGEWPCSKPCGVTLDCDHVCKGTCGTCWSGRVHVACKEKCGRALPGCGHKCRLPCGTDCLPCQQKSCGTSCRHSNCKQPCGTPCPPCNEACPWKSCPHRKCDALCHQPCPPCAQPCGKKLKCGPQDPPEGQGHSCSGLCGEKCFCFTCDRKNFVPLVITGVLTEEESVAVGEDTKLIKLPRCGHIFNVTVLDVYVKRKCRNLPPGGSLTCPVATCNKMILEADCWRYHRLLKERHDRFQKVKQDLITTTTISRGRRQKLLDSLALLNHDAEQEKSFASKAARGQIFKKDDIDVNTAFALTNQIKLARVFEKTSGVLQRVSTSVTKKDAKDAQILQNLLYKPMTHLTAQRLRELRLATRRFVDSSKLTLAQRFSNTESYFESITAILDAPSEQDLCDVGKTTKGATGVSSSASPRRSPTLPQQQHPASTCQTTTSSTREATSLATSHRLGSSATAEGRHNSSSVRSTGQLEGMAGARSSLLLGEKVSPHLSQSAESDAKQVLRHFKDELANLHLGEKTMDPPRPASLEEIMERIRSRRRSRDVE